MPGLEKVVTTPVKIGPLLFFSIPYQTHEILLLTWIRSRVLQSPAKNQSPSGPDPGYAFINPLWGGEVRDQQTKPPSVLFPAFGVQGVFGVPEMLTDNNSLFTIGIVDPGL